MHKSIDFKKAFDSVRREVLYNFLIEFGVPVKLVNLIQLCLTEMYSRFRVGKNLSDVFPIRNCLKRGDALSPLLFNFVLDYSIRRVQVNQDGLKLNDTHQLLVSVGDVNILGRSLYTIKKNTEALFVGSQEVGVEVNADKNMYMVMSLNQNEGRSHNIKIDNSSFEIVEEFKYLRKTLTNRNSVQEK